MDIKVRFRFNAATGEVDLDLTDAGGTRLPRDEHNRLHDEVAASLGRMLERAPRVVEVLPRGEAPRPTSVHDPLPEPPRDANEPGLERTGR